MDDATRKAVDYLRRLICLFLCLPTSACTGVLHADAVSAQICATRSHDRYMCPVVFSMAKVSIA